MATRKPAPRRRPAARRGTHPFVVASTYVLLGAFVYGVGIDARGTTWPATAAVASGTAHLVSQIADSFQGDDDADQAPVVAAAAVTR